jgi:hypothetical protein
VLGVIKARDLTSQAQNVYNANTVDIRRAPVIARLLFSFRRAFVLVTK